MPASLLPLLANPRETLLVFEYIATHPTATVAAAMRDLHISNNTWYLVLPHLEDLGLIAPERAPGGRKVRRYNVTPQGERTLAILKELQGLVAHSRAALLHELEQGPPPLSDPRGGEILSHLIDIGERRLDWEAVREVEKWAAKLHRPGEGHLARAVVAHLNGRALEGERESAQTLAVLRGERESRSYRTALSVHAASLEMLGRPDQAFKEFLTLRKLAREAGDAVAQCEALLQIGILKGRLSQFADSAKFLQQGVGVAQKAGLKADEAKLLMNLGFTRFFVDLEAAIAANDNAVQAARVSGARLTLAHSLLNRALFLATKGERREALASLRAAQVEYLKGGEERGPEAHRDFLRLVRWTLRARPAPSLDEIRAQALRSANILPSPPLGGAAVAPSETAAGAHRQKETAVEIGSAGTGRKAR